MLYSGCFITLEGIEGCGKSTHAKKLLNALSDRDLSVILTKEPGGTELGHNIRKLLVRSHGINISSQAELFLYAADRAQHLQEVIFPALNTGKVVICDRFTDATMAYQGYARGIDKATIKNITGIVTQGLRPDLTLLLDLDVRQGLDRAFGRNQKNHHSQREDRFEQEGVDFHNRVRDGYLSLAETEPERIKIINADTVIEQLHMSIMETVLPLLKKKGIL